MPPRPLFSLSEGSFIFSVSARGQISKTGAAAAAALGLTVAASKAETNRATVTILVQPSPPVAVVGGGIARSAFTSSSAASSMAVTMDGCGTYDPEDRTFTGTSSIADASSAANRGQLIFTWSCVVFNSLSAAEIASSSTLLPPILSPCPRDIAVVEAGTPDPSKVSTAVTLASSSSSSCRRMLTGALKHGNTYRVTVNVTRSKAAAEAVEVSYDAYFKAQVADGAAASNALYTWGTTSQDITIEKAETGGSGESGSVVPPEVSIVSVGKLTFVNMLRILYRMCTYVLYACRCSWLNIPTLFM